MLDVFLNKNMFDFRPALCHNSTFRTWQLGLLCVLTVMRGFSVPVFCLLVGLLCLCFLLLPCNGGEGVMGVGGDNVHANAANIY